MTWSTLLTLLSCSWLVQADTRPNIVLIMADDLGWGDVSPNNPRIKYTPNIDKLAASGIRYRDYHSAASVCTPSRAGLLTGRLGQRTGVISNFGVYSKGGLPLTEHTMGDYLQGAGYKTGIIGKWHLGHTHDYHPLSRGFQYWFGLPYSNDMGCIKDFPAYNVKVNPKCGENKMFNVSVPLYENRKIISQPVNLKTLTTQYAIKANLFINSSVSEGKPFFLYIPMTHVHVPLAMGSEPTGDHFKDAVIEMDWFVGQIVSYLADAGVSNNTLVMFTSDNGPWEYKCDLAGTAAPFLGTWQKRQGGGGSSSKMTTWEGGHRVPFIVSWPAQLPAGAVSDELVSAYDILPSLALLAGFTLPKDREFDGVPLPFCKPPPPHPRALFHPDVDLLELWAVRYSSFKVYYATYPDHDCEDNFGAGFLYHNPALIFNLTDDVTEAGPMAEVPEWLYHEIESLKKEKRDNIYTTFRSSVDWSREVGVAPCCDTSRDYCTCPGQ